MAFVHSLLLIIIVLFLYIGVFQVFSSVNNVLLTFFRLCLRLCNTTGDRIRMPMDTPLISYLRALLSRWQSYNNTDTNYMITLISKKKVN